MINISDQESTIITLNKAINNYNQLQIRLDPSNILNEFKMFLNAEIEVVKEVEGVFKREVIPIGIPKANKQGIAAILNRLSQIVNPQVVQGNFAMDNHGKSMTYDQYIYEVQISLGDMIYGNLYAYGIEEDEAQTIIDGMMDLIIPFMTRLLGNEERKSYGETFREINNVAKQTSNMLPNLFKA